MTGVGRPNGVAYGTEAVWVTDSADNMLLRVDSAGQVNDRIPAGCGPAGVVVAGGTHYTSQLHSGPLAAVATCQVLPRPRCPVTAVLPVRAPARPGGAGSAPDLARAGRLMQASGTRGDKVTVL